MGTNMKNESKETIQKNTPEDPSIHPLDFYLLIFHVFSGFLKTFKQSIKRTRTTDEHDDVNENVVVCLNVGVYDNACSAWL